MDPTLTFLVLVNKHVRYRVLADSPEEAQALALWAALGIEAERTRGRVTVEAKTVTVAEGRAIDRPEAGVVE